MFVGRLRGQNVTQSISHKRTELHLSREQRGRVGPQAARGPRSLSVIAEVALISSTEDPLTIKYCRTTRAHLFNPRHSRPVAVTRKGSKPSSQGFLMCRDVTKMLHAIIRTVGAYEMFSFKKILQRMTQLLLRQLALR